MTDQEHDARWKGYTQGLYGEPKTANPHALYTVTRVAWRAGWEKGHAGSKRMKKNKVRAW